MKSARPLPGGRRWRMVSTGVQMDECEPIKLRRLRKRGQSEVEAHKWLAKRRKKVSEGIREILCRAVRESSAHGPDVTFNDDTLLLAEGIIDSIGIFSVMSEIEQELGCILPPDEITADNFRSINALSALVQRLVDAAAISKEFSR